MEPRMRKGKYTFFILLFAAVLIILFLTSFLMGRYSIAISDIVAMLWEKIADLLHFPQVMHTEATWSARTQSVFFYVRLPRILLACLVGCCLSTAGASYQGIFQNPMAAPDILGASSGAAFGAALAILLGQTTVMITVFAFVSSMVTVLIVTLISRRASGSKVLVLVLSGIMVSSLFSSGTSYIKLVADPNDQLPAITYWLMGSLTGADIKTVGLVCIPMLIGIIPLMLLRWRMNLLTLGDEEATSMGINTGRIRILVIIFATLITASSVSVSGMIGWVGLVIPHFARRIVGNNYMHLLPMTMIIGAIFLLGVDDISRNLLATEIPLGILTSIVGAPFFIYLIRRKEILR
ncbi:FecCD family ABC transporter permease [Eubacterium oxidoreducens]|nr:iron ABC transporter permease [Eubacterium oxidoreducens]